jgi:hypothetical protein
VSAMRERCVEWGLGLGLGGFFLVFFFTFFLFPGYVFEFAGVLVWTVVLYVLVVLGTGVCI